MIDGAGKTLHNPYIGARPFRRSETIYGRARETRDLLSMLVGDRIVLLNSPSGAGKTSLIQASLIPRLEKRRFVVRPTIRVGTPAPLAGANRYLLSVMQSLEEGRPPAEQLPVEVLAGVTLRDYLAQHTTQGAEHGQVLIFDQFEEVLTLDPADEAARRTFFEQLGDALTDEWIWALFVIREEYVAALEPYANLVPTRFANSFRLGLLSVEAAGEAIRGPAESRGVTFEDAAVEALARDLAKIVVQDAQGRAQERVGTSVEPVQLQVVCYRLWEKRFADGAAAEQTISLEDVHGLGSIDRALEEYYESGVARAAAAGQVRERAVRAWVDTQLITRQGFRSQVLAGNEGSFGLNDATVDGLTNAYLVREERRRGMAWLELAHDRLIAPVRASNRRWFAAHLSPLQRQAEVWVEQGQPASLLFRDAELAEAEAWAEANAAGLTENERNFLESCREERRRAEERARQARRIRTLAWVASAVGVVALILAGVAFAALVSAQRSEATAVQQAHAAQTAESRAVAAEADAREQLRLSEAQRLTVAAQSQLQSNPQTALLLAYEADALDDNPVTNQTLRDALTTTQWRPLSLPGHTEVVNSAVFSPDGARILTASDDTTARLWDASGKPIATLEGHTEEVTTAIFSPDGANLLTASHDRTVRLWSSASALVVILKGHTDYPTTLAFSSDGAQILTASRDNSARLWNTKGQLLAVFQGHTDWVTQATFSPDGTQILTASRDNSARLWGTEGQLIATLGGHTDAVWGAMFSPDGRTIVTAASDATAGLWARNAPAFPAQQMSDFIQSLSFSPDGQQILAGSADGSGRLWDLRSNTLTTLEHSDPAFPYSPTSVAFSPDGTSILTANWSRTARLWDRSGKLLAVLSGHENGLNSAVFSPDGKRILTSSWDYTARLWDLSGAQLAVLKGHTDIVVNALFSPDGTRILTVSNDYTARLWDLSGAQLAVFEGHTDMLYNAAFSPDGTRVVTASNDGTARIWDLTGRQLAVLQGHTSSVYSAIFSPDGTHVLTTSEDKTARLWDLDGKLLATFTGHSNGIWGATYSPDANSIVTYAFDKTARLWDTTGQLLSTFGGSTAVIWQAAFSRDGRYVATASQDGMVRTYPVFTEDVLRAAACRVGRGLTEDEIKRFQVPTPLAFFTKPQCPPQFSWEQATK